jgi:hypothetical protein
MNFVTFVVSSQTITGVTAELLPHWNRNYNDMNWVRQALSVK